MGPQCALAAPSLHGKMDRRLLAADALAAFAPASFGLWRLLRLRIRNLMRDCLGGGLRLCDGRHAVHVRFELLQRLQRQRIEPLPAFVQVREDLLLHTRLPELPNVLGNTRDRALLALDLE